MTTPLQQLLDHARGAQAAVQAQRDHAAQIAQDAAANRAQAAAAAAPAPGETPQGQASGG